MGEWRAGGLKKQKLFEKGGEKCLRNLKKIIGQNVATQK